MIAPPDAGVFVDSLGFEHPQVASNVYLPLDQTPPDFGWIPFGTQQVMSGVFRPTSTSLPLPLAAPADGDQVLTLVSAGLDQANFTSCVASKKTWPVSPGDARRLAFAYAQRLENLAIVIANGTLIAEAQAWTGTDWAAVPGSTAARSFASLPPGVMQAFTTDFIVPTSVAAGSPVRVVICFESGAGGTRQLQIDHVTFGPPQAPGDAGVDAGTGPGADAGIDAGVVDAGLVITVPNGSFEAPALTMAGEYRDWAQIPLATRQWDFSVGVGAVGSFLPTSTSLNLPLGGGGRGSQVVTLVSATGPTCIASFGLSAVTPLATYELAVAYAERKEAVAPAAGRFEVMLKLDTVVVASDVNIFATLPPRGDFREMVVRWTAPASASGTLSARICYTSDINTKQVQVDAVRLTRL